MRVEHSSQEERLRDLEESEAEKAFRELDPIRFFVWSGIGLAVITFWLSLAWWLFAYI